MDKALRNRGIIVNHKRLQRILRENDLQSKLYIVRKIQWTVQSEKKDLLRQNFHADRLNEKWTTDITCFRILSKPYYLMCIMDLYDGSIIRHEILPSMKATSAMDCVKAAILDRQRSFIQIKAVDFGARPILLIWKRTESSKASPVPATALIMPGSNLSSVI